ncbi:methyltransferase, partial [Vibrio natriegens]
VPDLAGQDGKTATKNTVLDIGTGSGLLALMAAQRTTEHTTVTAIELDAGAALAAQHNFADSPWSSRLTLVNADVQTWVTAQPAGAYPAIVCNPPYFNHG